MSYVAAEARYLSMRYNRCGRSGLKLPAISLGLWHNFGGVDSFEDGRAIVRRAFDLGITHFDLANNYGPPPGSAEESFGAMLKADGAQEILMSVLRTAAQRGKKYAHLLDRNFARTTRRRSTPFSSLELTACHAPVAWFMALNNY